ncbi:hypothetical protein PPBDW_I21764 [Photobacterium kishitanii]|nr:hypothetical protein PPBDW_I21764 [Photobacterium kishitanii]
MLGLSSDSCCITKYTRSLYCIGAYDAYFKTHKVPCNNHFIIQWIKSIFKSWLICCSA